MKSDADSRGAFKVPILFVVFNRPQTTRLVFEEIRRIHPSKLYIASDGSRMTRENEEEKVQETRKYILEHVDWKCDVHTRFNSSNMGCMVNVSTAISWLFQTEESGIILEDDCIPDQSFFPYCEELLKRYANDEDVYAIGGACFSEGNMKSSYGFSHILQPWGWATWRRVWNQYSTEIPDPTDVDSSRIFRSLPHRSRIIWRSHFTSIKKKLIDTWDYQFIHMLFLKNGYVTFPKRNLVKNIGFDTDATHTKRVGRASYLEAKRISFPLIHPETKFYDPHYFRYMNRFYSQRCFLTKVRDKVKRTLFHGA